MNSIDFENDTSIVFKTHSLTLNRNKKGIKLILVYHFPYEVIEIKIYEISPTKLIGREILTYSDIFEIFDNFFLCFNENMLNIFEFINNCFLLKKYQANVNQNLKVINIDFLILKECELAMKTLSITSYQDIEGYSRVIEKINKLNYSMKKGINNNYRVAPINYIKYENELYCLYIEIFIEKEIDILGIKAKVICKNDDDNINILQSKDDDFYAEYYSIEEMNSITRNYYHSIGNLEEISKEIKINFYNKNIKIEGINEEKLKLRMKVISSSINACQMDLILLKNKDIKDKYIEIIQLLKLKNEYLIKREIFQDKNPKKNLKNNSSNSCNITSEKNLLGKKKKRDEIIMKKESNLDKKSKKGKISKSKVNSKTKNNEYDIILKENENDNENKLI